MSSGHYNNPFPHDGEHGRSCTGYGCDCDEKNYGHHSGGYNRGDGGNNGLIWIITIVIALCIGAFNELLGAIFILIIGFILLVK